MARCLVVDDRAESRRTLAQTLGEGGHDVRTQGKGPDGLETARLWLPDVIILRLHMQGMSGFELVERLKGDPVTSAIPVLFLTGEPPADEVVVRGLELGAYDFLSEGSRVELLARVGAMYRLKRDRDELRAIARISDALLRSVTPRAIAREFTSEACGVFRADAAILALERNGKPRLRVRDGIEADNRAVVSMLRKARTAYRWTGGVQSRILDSDGVATVIEPYFGDEFRSAALACVRRGPSQALIVILGRRKELFRQDQDRGLLENLSGQAALAIEHALLHERARLQAQHLERAMYERSRFFASLSHELRTPINAVIGYNRLIEEEIFGELTPQQVDALDKANRSAQHLLALVDDILDISKIEAGKLEMESRTVDLSSLIRDTTTSVRLQAEEKGIDFAMEAPGELEIRTDPARVRQIVLNLLSNAIKFTEEGQVRLRVDANGSDRIRLQVSDTGPGIDPQDQERIFEEFERVRLSSGERGTGLGLAISRRLAKLLGGWLAVDSEPGVGSTFTLVLPRDWDPPPPPEKRALATG